MPFVNIDIFVVVTEIIFPLDIILGQDLVKLRSRDRSRGGRECERKISMDRERSGSFANYVLLLSVSHQ